MKKTDYLIETINHNYVVDFRIYETSGAEISNAKELFDDETEKTITDAETLLFLKLFVEEKFGYKKEDLEQKEFEQYQSQLIDESINLTL